MGYPDKPPASDSRSDAARVAAWAALSTELRECGEIAGQRLSLALSRALRQAEESLFAASAESSSQAERDANLDAAELARARADSLVADFSRHFNQRYVRACRHKPSLITCFRIDFDPAKLEIVKHDLLDDSLEPGKIEEAIKSASWATLQNLTSRFAALLGNPAIKSSEIPLSPHLIEAALSDAMRDQPWRHAAKHPLMRCLRGYLPEAVNRLYHDLTLHLLAVTGLPSAAEAEIESETVAFDLPPPSEPVPEVATALEATPEPIHAPATQKLINHPLNQPAEIAATAPCEVLPHRIEPAHLPRPAEPCQPTDSPINTTKAPVKVILPTRIVEPSLPSANPQTINATRKGSAPAQVQLTELAVGTWLEFRAADDSVTLLKLAWVSPRRNLYLLTNRQGQRALSMLAAELETALADGRAHVAEQHAGCLNTCPTAGQRANKTA